MIERDIPTVTQIAGALRAIEDAGWGVAMWDRVATSPIENLDYTKGLARRNRTSLQDAARRVVEEALDGLRDPLRDAARALYGASDGSVRVRTARERLREARRLYAASGHASTGHVQDEIHSEVAAAILSLRERHTPVRRPHRPPRSSAIGVIAPLSSWHTSYHVDLVRALRKAGLRWDAKNRRRLVVIDVPRDDPDELDAVLTDNLTLQASGLIVVNFSLSPEAKAALGNTGIPVAMINDEDQDPPVVCTVIPDHSDFENMLRATIAEKKCESAILLTRELTGSTAASPAAARLRDGGATMRLEKRATFERVATDAGLRGRRPASIHDVADIDVSRGDYLVVEVDQYRAEYGERLFRDLGKALPYNTCVCFLADVPAIAFIQACALAGTSIRDRGFRVTGFDNTPQAAMFDLTSVDYRLDDIARFAYDRLQTALDTPIGAAVREVVPVKQQPRGSSTW